MGKKVEEELRWNRNVLEQEKGIETNKESIRGVWEARSEKGQRRQCWDMELEGLMELERFWVKGIWMRERALCHILGLPLSHSCKSRSQSHCSHKPNRLLPAAGCSPCLAPCT